MSGDLTLLVTAPLGSSSATHQGSVTLTDGGAMFDAMPTAPVMPGDLVALIDLPGLSWYPAPSGYAAAARPGRTLVQHPGHPASGRAGRADRGNR